MFVIVVDIVALLMVASGIALLLRSNIARPASEQGDPGTYARRIGGTMLAAFGLAIGLMVTLFHFVSLG